MARDEQSYTRTPPVVDGEHTLDRVETVLAAAARQVATELDASEPSRYGARDASARPRGNGTRDLRGDDAATMVLRSSRRDDAEKTRGDGLDVCHASACAPRSLRERRRCKTTVRAAIFEQRRPRAIIREKRR